MELESIVFFLNTQANKYKVPYQFTSDKLSKDPIKFKILSQNEYIVEIELDNNIIAKEQDLLNKTFVYGKTSIEILQVEMSNPIKLTLNSKVKLPKRIFELEHKTNILVSNSYVWNNNVSNAIYIVNKRINFGVSIDTDPNGKVYDNILNFVSKVFYDSGNTIPLYDEEKKEIIKNKYISLAGNVNTSEFVDNRDNIHRVFYVIAKTYNNINRRN